MNETYHKGSIVSLWTTRDVLRCGEDIILMDADVLYARGIMSTLVTEPVRNRFLYDRNFEPGDEPVKICLRNNRIVEFRKRLGTDLEYNELGESVGFFSFTAKMAGRLAAIADTYVAGGRCEEPYEEAIRDLVLSYPNDFRVEDISGSPWVEIDFPNDIIRANRIVLPRIDER